MSKAHEKIEITDAHGKLARGPSRRATRGTRENQASEKEGRMISPFGKWLGRVVSNLKAKS